jgi:nuclear pore complex protein Nup93
VRQFVRLDAKEALQYVYTVTLGADQPGGIGKEQLELAWDLVRRVILLANAGPAWDELVGGFRADGMRFVCLFPLPYTSEAHQMQTGVVEQAAPLLKLHDAQELNAEVFVPAARQAEESDRVLQAIKLYNLAGEYTTVVSSLATALGTTLAAPGGGGERARTLEAAAIDIIRHYERMGRAPGRVRDAVVKLLRVREALDAKAEGRVDRALEVSGHDMTSTQLDDECRSWSQRTLSHSMATWRRSIDAQRNLRTCMIPCSATYTRTSHSRWMP